MRLNCQTHNSEMTISKSFNGRSTVTGLACPCMILRIARDYLFPSPEVKPVDAFTKPIESNPHGFWDPTVEHVEITRKEDEE